VKGLNLASITMGESTMHIGDGALAGCGSFWPATPWPSLSRIFGMNQPMFSCEESRCQLGANLSRQRCEM